MADKDYLSSEDDKAKGSSEDHPLVMDVDDPTMLVRHEVRKGSRLGDERVRLVRPTLRAFRRVNTGLRYHTAGHVVSYRGECGGQSHGDWPDSTAGVYRAFVFHVPGVVGELDTCRAVAFLNRSQGVRPRVTLVTLLYQGPTR